MDGRLYLQVSLELDPLLFSLRRLQKQRLTTQTCSWDDWVPQERLRKLTEENKELASNLKKDMDAQRRAATGKPAPASVKKKAYGADLSSSTRGSEDRSSAVPQAPRGTKRGREIEGIDKVRFPTSLFCLFATSVCLVL